jgi:chemotaxis protein MotB
MPIPRKPKEGAPDWMVSFSDLQQLLLVFFILLFSMSTTDDVKFNAMMASISEALKTDGLGLTDSGDSTLNYEVAKDIISEANKDILSEIAAQKNNQLNEELKEAQDFLENTSYEGKKLSEYISADKSEEGIVLTINDIVLFDSGSAEIKQDSKSLINKLEPLLNGDNAGIRVEGHTDNVGLSANSKYKDNWELSTARATEVVSFIINEHIIDPSSVSVAGYSEYRPVADNDTAENRAKNRRVAIVLISDFEEAERKAQEIMEQLEKLENASKEETN